MRKLGHKNAHDLALGYSSSQLEVLGYRMIYYSFNFQGSIAVYN